MSDKYDEVFNYLDLDLGSVGRKKKRGGREGNFQGWEIDLIF